MALLAAGTAACVLRGFFFTGEMYLFLTVWFGLCGVLLGLVLIYMAAGRGAQVEEQPERRKHIRELAGSIGGGRGLAIWGLLSACVLLCLLYAIQALGSPVSAQGTLNEMLRSGFYTSFVTFALLAARTRRGVTLLAAVWHLLGITISLSALLAVCGGLPIPYAVAYTQSQGVSATGARLAGLLQYPNAFGAVMAVYLLERLFAAAYSFGSGDSGKAADGEKNGAFGGVAVGGVDKGGAGSSAVRASVSGAGEVGAEGVGVGNNAERMCVSRAGEAGAEGVGAGNNAVRMGDSRACEVGTECAGVDNNAERMGVRGAGEVGTEGTGAGNNAERVCVSRAGEAGAGDTGAGKSSERTGGSRAREEGAGDSGINWKRTGTWSASHWLRAARLLPLFPYAAALLLSESRGAWLAAAAAGVAALLLKRQLFVPLLITGAAPVAAAALLYRQLARSGLAAEPLPGLLLLAGLWAGAWLAGLWLHRRSCRAAGGHRAAVLALAAAVWTAAASAVLLLVRARITGPSPTAAARGLFYRDAWKLAAEAPWLGSGGETWRHTYLAAQSRPYVGSQVHSGYLDILLNLGMAGLAAAILLLLAAGWLVFKASPRLLPPLLVIILHSAADFDWSYGLVWLLLLLLPAWAIAEANSRTARTAVPTVLHDSRWRRSKPAGQRKNRLRRLWRYAGITVLCGLTLLCSGLSFQAMKGAALFKQAVRESDPAVRITLLQQSLSWNPREPQTAVALSRLLPQKQGVDLLLRSLSFSLGDVALHGELAASYLRGSDPGEALYWVRRSQQTDRFNADRRLAALKGMLEMGERSLAEGDRRIAADSAAAGLELLRQYSLLTAKEQDRGPQHNDRNFTLLPQSEGIYFQLTHLQSQAALSSSNR
ncbi:O-antigen ligase family protein [Paenibacillus silagei]|uniref:O-antigen ligase family protein n=1 Tax=Paenibacillus silagei TaxID=1670801 RepID=UPI001FD8D1D8|nr:O-antigen ligase family protein [Paenibacillus silagei]